LNSNSNHILYLALGSNIGNREENLRNALKLLEQLVGKVEQVSAFYETKPLGFHSTHLFLNAACRTTTLLSPHQCLRATQRIERQLGRADKSENGVYKDRPIDIDLLLYDDLHIQTSSLTLPHPRMLERPFVMQPLKEVLLPKDAKLCSNKA